MLGVVRGGGGDKLMAKALEEERQFEMEESL
jgi:hypothetical protein